jgi:hypothetical protein
VKTISLKKVSAVAVASLGFGLMSVVPAQAAAVDPVYTYTTAANKTSTTPSAAGTAVVATLVSTTQANAVTQAIVVTPTFKLLDPNGTDVTSTAVCAAAADNSIVTTVSVTTATCAFTYTVTVATAAASNIGTMTFTPTMGGLYTIQVSQPVNTSTNNTTTTALVAGVGGGALAGSMHISGIRVSQGTTLGLTGAAKIANQAQVSVLLPANPNSLTPTYKFVSSGVGAITGATAVNASSTANISGVATDFSAGTTMVRTNNTTLTTMLLTLTNAATSGVQTITVTTVDATTGLSTALYSTTVTWSAIAALAPAASIVRIAPTGATGATQATVTPGATYTTTADAIPYSAPKATGNRVAKIEVILVNNDGTAATQGHKVTASVSGAGFVLTNDNATAADGTAREESETLTVGTENIAWINVSGDGTAGTGTISISVTDVDTGVKTSLPSKTVTFYNTVTKLAVTTTNYTIGKAGQAVGGSIAGRTTAAELGAAGVTITSTSTPAFVVTTTDSGGRNSTAAAVPTVISSDANVATGGTCVLDTYADADYSASPSAGGTGSVGVYNCSWSAAANAASGSKATLTVRIADPASTTGGYLTATVAVTIGGSISTETVEYDKASYAPGEAMVITRTAKDSAGNPVFDGATAGAVSFNKAVGGTAPAASMYIGGRSASSTTVAKSKVFAPSIPGALTASMTGGDAAATVRTAIATVTDANAGLLTQIDALNAKIVALNALIAKIMKKLGVK